MNTPRSEEIRERVRGFVAQNFYVPDVAKLRDADSLVESGIVDSTGVLEVLTFVEQEFGLQVDDSEVVPANFDSIQNLVDFIEKKSHSTAEAR